MNTATRVHERTTSQRGRTTGFVDRHIACVLIAPTVLCMLIVNLYPLLDALVVSFPRYTLNTPKPAFIGIQNYREVVTDPSICWAVGRSVELTALTVAISFAIGLVLALILNKPFPGRSIVRSLFLIPWAMPAFVAALVWGVDVQRSVRTGRGPRRRALSPRGRVVGRGRGDGLALV